MIDVMLVVFGMCAGAAMTLGHYLPIVRRHLDDATRGWERAERHNTWLLHELAKRGVSIPTENER